MLTYLLLALLPAAEIPANPGASTIEEPVRLRMNSNRAYRPGERVNVEVETGVGGYLFVLQYAPDGRIKVLFPVDPRDDAQVRAGRRYEVRDVGEGQSFFADDAGPGFVLAALGPEPWRFDLATAGGAWDYGVLNVSRDTDDPETEMIEVLQRLTSPDGFDYDLIPYAVQDEDYVVVDRHSTTTYVTMYDYGYDPWYRCWSCYRGSIFIGIGDPYPRWWYEPWGYYGHRYRYRSAYYDPYGPYYPYSPYYPYYPYRPWGGGIVLPGRPNKIPAVIGRPRGYTVGEISPWGTRTRQSSDMIGGGFRTDRTAGSGTTEARPPARRSRDRADETRRPSGGSTGATAGRNQPGTSRPSTARPSESKPKEQPAPTRSRPRSRDNGTAATASATAPASAPNIERGRTETSPARWTRVTEEQPAARARPAARPVRESRPATERRAVAEARPVSPSRPMIERSRPEARPAAEARRVERPGSERATPARTARPVAGRARPASGSEVRTRPAPSRETPRAAPAPSRSAPKASAPAARGQSSGGKSSKGSASSGGRSRSRGNN